MLRQGTTWLACIAMGLVSLTVAPDDADAGWRRARRLGYNNGCCQTAGVYNSGWQNSGACCGAVQQTAFYQQPIYQQATYQPAGDACSVQQSGYQTYNHTSGYAPQGQIQQQGYHQGGVQTGTNRQPPPPPAESDDAPRTFDEAPQPKDSDN